MQFNSTKISIIFSCRHELLIKVPFALHYWCYKQLLNFFLTILSSLLSNVLWGGIMISRSDKKEPSYLAFYMRWMQLQQLIITYILCQTSARARVYIFLCVDVLAGFLVTTLPCLVLLIFFTRTHSAEEEIPARDVTTSKPRFDVATTRYQRAIALSLRSLNLLACVF